VIEQAHPTQPSDIAPTALRHLPRAWLWSARVLWLAIFAFMLVLNGAAIAAQLRQLNSGGGAAGLKAQLNPAQGYILTVDPRGPAAQAGIQDGNLLLAINGMAIQPDMPYGEVNARLHGDIGAAMTLRVEGLGGEQKEYTLTLIEEDRLQIWRRFRVPFGLVGAYLPTIEGILLASYLLMSGMIFWRRSDDWLALYLSITLVLITPQLSYSWYFLSQSAAHWEGTLGLILAVAVAFTLPNFYLLPDGKFVPRWTIVIAAIWVVWCITMELFPEAPFSIYQQAGATQSLIWLGAFATGMLAQVYRYRYVATPMERQQIKWHCRFQIPVVGY
jgi:hypothetical protein